MNRQVNYNAREFAGWIKMLRKWKCQQCWGSCLFKKKKKRMPLRTRLLEQGSFQGAARCACVCFAHVIFLHVQMTCQLLLNYTRHLDQSGQCQRWLILFIVAAMKVPVDARHHKNKKKSHAARDYEGEPENAAETGRPDWMTSSRFARFHPQMIRYHENRFWKSVYLQIVEIAWGIWLGKKKKSAPARNNAYSLGKARIIAEHKPKHAYIRFHVDGWKSFEYSVQLKMLFICPLISNNP